MFKLRLNIRLCLSILNLLCFVQVKSDCILSYPDDEDIAPIYTRYFGRYSLKLPYTSSNIILQNNETIAAKCSTGFSLNNVNRRGYYYDPYESIDMEHQTLIKLYCKETTLYLEEHILEDNKLECKKLNWSIYENSKTQNWCNTNTGLAALLLATQSNADNHVLAEVCFDLNSWSLKTITYNVTSPLVNYEMLRDVVETKLHTVDVLGENLWNLKSTNDFGLTDLDLQEQLKAMSQHNSWLHLANYELSPIVQGKSYEKYFNEYSNILNTIWWSNLRLGNWKRFMETLENYAHNNSFQLYTGTSGVVRKPIYHKAELSKDLTIEFDFKKKPIPAYIWTYLTSTDKTNKDFVIVGYNSPYAEFFSRNEIIFCPDICNEISWLHGIYESFKFNTAGIMFCCSPETLQHTNPLNGFPMEVLISRTNILPNRENKTFLEDSTLSLDTTSPTIEHSMIKNPEKFSTTVANNNNIFKELIYADEEEDNADIEDRW